MMQPSGQVDINATLRAWADIVIEKFRFKITELKVYDKGNLDESLLYELLINSGENIEKIEFAFKLYGIFVDMGVGKEMPKGNGGDLGFTPTRRAKPWYSKKYYGQVMKLRQILIDRFSVAITLSLVNTFSEDFDQRYSSNLRAATVKNLRTVRYRAVASAARSRRRAELLRGLN